MGNFLHNFELPDFGERLVAEELMDSPDADPALLRRTIEQFSAINALVSWSARRAIAAFFPLMERGREYSLVDVGAGGCDIPIGIVRAARWRGLRLRVLALDRDERVIPWAREAAAPYHEIEVRRAEAKDLRGLGEVDFVISNHLMHHLAEGEIGDFVRDADKIARRGLVLDDLLRSAWSWLGYSAYAALFARRSLAFVDGRLSIRRGFRRAELEGILAKSGAGEGVRVFEAFPGRIGYIRVGER
jgi:2-polyprenyl-3-methyl-5-hydroxy-6-metoxy-1,4-benzoquinol methylase